MIKLAVFDLDGTLAELGEWIQPENVALLKKLEERGIRVAICSGKPAYYLCGLLRQVGLKQPLIAGENGAVVQSGITLPPKDFWIQPYSEKAKKSIAFLKAEFDRVLPNMWYQPNLVGLTPFPSVEEELDIIQEIIDENKTKLEDIEIYRHVDCFDFMPSGLSKKAGIIRLEEMLGITSEEVVCVGDGVNDYPMFEHAGLALGIRIPEKELVDMNFLCVNDALRYLISKTEEKYVIDSSENKEFLRKMRNELFSFGRNFASPVGSSYYLGTDGTPMKDKNRETWITSRMAHVYSIGALLGHEGSESLADAALEGLKEELYDQANGGWYAGFSADGGIIPTKQCYAHAFVILAATSGILANRPGAGELLKEALEVYDRYFWDEKDGLARDTWDTEFKNLSDYRGLNANMHSVEAFLAVADVTGNEMYRERAGRIIRHVIGWAKSNEWRIPEHFDSNWNMDLECNKDTPDDQFKPYGATPGHGIEWARLITQWACSTYESEKDRYEYVESAERLFQRAIADAWNVDGAPGICYTTDWDGRPVVHDRMHWTLAEAINTSAVLYHLTGKAYYATKYYDFMKYLDEKVLDHENKSWFHQLDRKNQVLDTVWPGKPDIYHALQATLIPYSAIDTSVAVAVH